LADQISIPVIEHDGQRWAALAYFGKDQDITGEDCKTINQKYSFKGGHRVRIYRVKKQVYWKIPPMVLDISNVPTRRVQR
jgi:hypothetical protein